MVRAGQSAAQPGHSIPEQNIVQAGNTSFPAAVLQRDFPRMRRVLRPASEMVPALAVFAANLSEA
jgi:hypothetical protein